MPSMFARCSSATPLQNLGAFPAAAAETQRKRYRLCRFWQVKLAALFVSPDPL